MTLEELNRVYMAENKKREFNAEFEPITPLVIEVELLKTVKSPDTGKPERKVSGTSANRVSAIRSGMRSLNKRRLFTAISDMLFSLAIAMILFVVLVPGTDDGTPKSIFNYSYFTVISPSMQDEIPQGSFILVKYTDPLELMPGDNITYMSDRSTSVTHKIVEIYENYDSSGARGFLTKGVNNHNPDRDVVYEADVVGKVIFVLPVLGVVLQFLSENVFLVFIIFGLCVLLSFLLRGIFSKPAEQASSR